MTVYIDISNYIDTRAHTGIQRVVREFLYKLLENKASDTSYKVIFFNKVLKSFSLLDNITLLNFLNNSKEFDIPNNLKSMSINEFSENDIFYDMDGCWGSTLKRTFLYKKLKESKVKIYNFIYDLVPIKRPEFSHRNTVISFVNYIYAVLQYSDLVMFDSRSAERDFLEIKEQIKNTRNITTKVVKLGSQIFEIKSDFSEKTRYKSLLNTKYLLFVGTVEPRKNQKLLLDVFEDLYKLYPDLNLIFIGKEGWNNSILINRLNTHHLLDKNIFWLKGIDDKLLNKFYKNAFLCVYLSEYEGFGLPITESLGLGKITITSNNSSMYEVGKDFADYLDYNSHNELFDIIKLYLDNPYVYAKKLSYIKEQYKPYTWSQFYEQVTSSFETEHTLYIQSQLKNITKLQFVFISIDYDNLERTISNIDRYIDFVDEYIIITNPESIDKFKGLRSKYYINLIDENKILPISPKEFKELDHTSKNWVLRSTLAKLDIIKDNFIMLDDDNCPIKNISLSNFITDDGRYCAYYYYDLLDWTDETNPYDIGQKYTRSLLDNDELQLLSYSSHRPQIINKAIFSEVIDIYSQKVGVNKPIDEWNIYFNYATSKYSQLFIKKVFDTLNWPASPTDWFLNYIPKEYNFENYYSYLYEKNIFLNDKDSDLELKTKRRNDILEPHIKNKELALKNNIIMQHLNMVHGIMEFYDGNSTILLSNIPYYIEAYQGSWISLPLNIKMIDVLSDDLYITYYIDNHVGHHHRITVDIDHSYQEKRTKFMVSCATLPIGMHNLCINMKYRGKYIYSSENDPYLIKLNILPSNKEEI